MPVSRTPTSGRPSPCTYPSSDFLGAAPLRVLTIACPFQNDGAHLPHRRVVHIFTVCIIQVDENPNLIMKVAREAPWAQQHPDIMGPSNAFLYFGPGRTPGHLIYGNSTYHTMAQARNRKKETSTYVLPCSRRLLFAQLPPLDRDISGPRTAESTSGGSHPSGSR